MSTISSFINNILLVLLLNPPLWDAGDWGGVVVGEGSTSIFSVAPWFRLEFDATLPTTIKSPSSTKERPIQ